MLHEVEFEGGAQYPYMNCVHCLTKYGELEIIHGNTVTI
jgi:hypothetical protein